MGKINDAADAEGASVAFGPYGRRTLFATATRYESVACDEGRFIFPEECASALLGLSAPRSATCSLKPLTVASTCGSEGKRLEAQSSSSLTLTLRKLMECKGPDGRYLVTRKVHWQAVLGITPRNVRKIAES